MSTTEIVDINNDANDAAESRPYKLRSLKDKDLFPILDIITETLPDGLEDIFTQLFVKKKNDKDASTQPNVKKSLEEIGGMVVYEIAVSVLKNVSTIPDKIYALLSDLSGIPADEIPEMPFGTTPGMIWDVVNDAKNASFFGELSKLL